MQRGQRALLYRTPSCLQMGFWRLQPLSRALLCPECSSGTGSVGDKETAPVLTGTTQHHLNPVCSPAG